MTQVKKPQLQPLKIREDVEPASEALEKVREARRRFHQSIRKLVGAILVALLFFAYGWFPDRLPSEQEKARLPADQVTFVSEPTEINIYASSNDNRGNLLGKSGEPILLSQLITNFGDPSREEPGFVNLWFEKPGYKPVKMSIPTIELKAKVYPQYKKDIIVLSTQNPFRFVGYLATDRSMTFVLILLVGSVFAFFQLKVQKEDKLLQERLRLRDLDKSRDPLTGLSVLSHMVTKFLGEGGMSLVYQGVTEKDYKTVRVVRFCREDVLDEKTVSIWNRESAAYTKMEHPNVIKSYDAKLFNNTFAFILEFIEGEDLQDYLDANTPLKPEDALRIFEGIAAGLDHIHSQDVVHRDIKPANVMLRNGEEAVIIDFGLATDDKSSQITKTDVVRGTVSYMSPEQAMGTSKDRRLTHHTDQYSFGLILYEALSGQHAIDEYESGNANYGLHALGKTKPFQKIAPQYGVKVHEAIMKILEKKPTDRYPSCSAAFRAVKDAILEDTET